jgi:hypothetical protein
MAGLGIIFQFSCRKATELIEKRSLVGLTFVEAAMLFVHSLVCDGCKEYAKQSKFLDELMSRREGLEHFSKSRHSLKLDESFKEKLKNILANKGA